METVCIGEIMTTHGIRGELKIDCYSDFGKQRFKKGNTIYVEYQHQLLPMKVASCRAGKDGYLVAFEDYLDINLVEKYKKCLVYFDKAAIPPLQKGDYYFFQLKGLNAFDEEGNSLGKVVDIEETVANNCLRIKNEEHEFLVPYVKAFVKEVNLEENKVVIKMIEGLL